MIIVQRGQVIAQHCLHKSYILCTNRTVCAAEFLNDFKQLAALIWDTCAYSKSEYERTADELVTLNTLIKND